MTSQPSPRSTRRAAPGVFAVWLFLIFLIFVSVSALGFYVQNQFNEAKRQSQNLILVLDDLTGNLRETVFWEIVHYSSVTQGNDDFLEYSEEQMQKYLDYMINRQSQAFDSPINMLFASYGASKDELDYDPDIAWYCAPEEEPAPEAATAPAVTSTEAPTEEPTAIPEEVTPTPLPESQLDIAIGERRLIVEFASRREELAILVPAMIAANQNESYDEYECLHLAYRENTTRMQAILGELGQKIEGNLVQASRQYNAVLPILLLVSVLGLMLLTVIGMLAFTSVAQVTWPVLQLTNVFNAVAGGQYTPEMLGGLADRKDALGAVAKSAEALIEQTAAAEANQQSELQALREQVKADRRQRMQSAVRPKGENS